MNSNFLIRILSILLLSYVFFISWTDAFALTGWLKLPVIIGLISFFLISLMTCFRGKISKKYFNSEELFLLAFLMLLMLNTLFFQYGFNYILAYIYVFAILYFILKVGFLRYVDIKKSMNANTYGILFVSIFILSNFILEFGFGFSLQNEIPRLTNADALYLGIITRSYGFSEEPAYVAHYLNTLGPIGLWNLWQNFGASFIKKMSYTLIIGVAWLLLFSTAGIVLLTFAVCVVLIYKLLTRFSLRVKRFTFYIGISSFVILVVVTFYISQNLYLISYLEPMITRITFSGEHGSSFQRLNTWKNDINLWSEAPIIGHGLGYTSMLGRRSSLNWFLFLALEAGILAPLLIIFFIAFVLYRMTKLNHDIKYFFMIGLIAGTSHFMLISTFYNSFVWLLIIIFYQYRLQKR